MKASNLQLGVNIDHVATIREARGTDYPDPVEAAGIVERAGAHGITVHLREDRRHIQDKDVFALRESIGTRLNLEMATAPEIVDIALRLRPDEVCLVPERREELTTEGGLDAAGMSQDLAGPVQVLKHAGAVVSLFIDPDPWQVTATAELGATCLEFHTGTFCDATGAAADLELDRLIAAARQAHQLGLQVNAGHGIHMRNIGAILEMPHLDTLNIGHSIVARAVMVGMHTAVSEMLGEMAAYRGGRAESA
ncbi:MAG: pyridoxine 5'-phosphate synthase [Verrucomicrobia bacterium]|nr:pyridoxine 5'-phosphate synthase [Verrucomicrobiota bacterium]MDA1087876.1 pyridoxine 5'-phosphate synthase [Verrucomicrobiota bacterium]